MESGQQPADVARIVSSKAELVGVWRLAAYVRSFPEEGVESERQVDGYLIYSEGGTVTAMVVEAGVEPPAGDVLTDEERIRLFNGLYGAFAGSYELVEPGVVSHRITTSWNVIWNGVEHVRYAEFEGGYLVVKTTPRRSELDGRLMVNSLRWRRIE
jgi:hypothetical protein